jgi:hypothetical protein
MKGELITPKAGVELFRAQASAALAAGPACRPPCSSYF